MSSELCAYCTGRVYPLEQFICLGKVWHKECFKCTDCGMTLNLKTFVGFEKLPYCQAHGPVSKLRSATATVIDTPEYRRIQRNNERRAAKAAEILAQEVHDLEYSVQQPFTPEDAVLAEFRQVPRPNSSIRSNNSSVSAASSTTRESTPKYQENLPKSPPASSRGSINSDEDVHRAGRNKEKSTGNKITTTNPGNNQDQKQQVGLTYKALFEYDAADVDEVSFIEGDLIVDCTAVDQGWLTGTIKRTMKRGMLPANFVVYTY